MQEGEGKGRAVKHTKLEEAEECSGSEVAEVGKGSAWTGHWPLSSLHFCCSSLGSLLPAPCSLLPQGLCTCSSLLWNTPAPATTPAESTSSLILLFSTPRSGSLPGPP